MKFQKKFAGHWPNSGIALERSPLKKNYKLFTAKPANSSNYKSDNGPTQDFSEAQK